MASLGHHALPLVLIMFYGAQQCRAQCANVTQLSVRLDSLLAEYDRETPPSAPVVRLQLDVRHASIDERASTVRMLADSRMSWLDDRLSWNVSEWGCESSLTVAERLWLPDVTLANAASIGTERGLRARIAANGEVSWTSRLDISAPIDMQLDNWPHDEQTVQFKFSSKGHRIDELDLEISDEQHSIVYETGAWQLSSVTGVRSLWDTGAGQQRLVTWDVVLRRRGAGSARAAAAVLLAAVLLLVAAGLLPPADRPALCIAATFTSMLWLVTCVMRLANSSTSPLLLRVMCGVCVCGAACAACAACAARVARVAAPPPPRLCALLSAVSTVCRLTPHQECGLSGGGAGAWCAFAILLDRALLAALGAALAVLLCCAATVLTL